MIQLGSQPLRHAAFSVREAKRIQQHHFAIYAQSACAGYREQVCQQRQ
jgi:hypothetical protein